MLNTTQVHAESPTATKRFVNKPSSSTTCFSNPLHYINRVEYTHLKDPKSILWQFLQFAEVLPHNSIPVTEGCFRCVLLSRCKFQVPVCKFHCWPFRNLGGRYPPRDGKRTLPSVCFWDLPLHGQSCHYIILVFMNSDFCVQKVTFHDDSFTFKSIDGDINIQLMNTISGIKVLIFCSSSKNEYRFASPDKMTILWNYEIYLQKDRQLTHQLKVNVTNTFVLWIIKIFRCGSLLPWASGILQWPTFENSSTGHLFPSNSNRFLVKPSGLVSLATFGWRETNSAGDALGYESKVFILWKRMNRLVRNGHQWSQNLSPLFTPSHGKYFIKILWLTGYFDIGCLFADIIVHLPNSSNQDVKYWQY